MHGAGGSCHDCFCSVTPTCSHQQPRSSCAPVAFSLIRPARHLATLGGGGSDASDSLSYMGPCRTCVMGGGSMGVKVATGVHAALRCNVPRAIKSSTRCDIFGPTGSGHTACTEVGEGMTSRSSPPLSMGTSLSAACKGAGIMVPKASAIMQVWCDARCDLHLAPVPPP